MTHNKTKHKTIYQERYQTFRHLDKLRWMMMQIGVTAASAIFVLPAQGGHTGKEVFLGTGIVLLFSALAMFRIGEAIIKNHTALQLAAQKIGDLKLPAKLPRKTSVSFWINIVMAIVSAVLIYHGIELIYLGDKT